MIHHFSLAVQEPERVARALGEIIGGRVITFPAHAGSFMVATGGPLDPAIELYPLDVELVPHEATRTVSFRQNPSPSRHTATHVAMSVPATEAQIHAVAAREGWTSQRVQRGPFDFVELWVEERIMLELFPSDIEKKLRFPAGGGRPQGSEGLPGGGGMS